MAVTKFSLRADSEDRQEFPPATNGTYIAHGDDDVTVVEAHAKAVLPNSLPSVYGVLYRQPITCRRIGWQIYEVDVNYAPRKWGPFEITVRGRTGGETQKILQSFKTVAFSAGAPIFSDVADGTAGQLIGYNPTDQTVEGVDVPVPSLDLSIDIKAPAGFLNLAYLDGLAGIRGRVNSTTFLIWPPGEVLAEGFEFSATDADSEFTFNVSIQKNLTDFVSAGLTITEKKGWDFLWFLTEKAVVAGVPIEKAVHWYTEETLLRADFAAVLGFG